MTTKDFFKNPITITVGIIITLGVLGIIGYNYWGWFGGSDAWKNRDIVNPNIGFPKNPKVGDTFVKGGIKFTFTCAKTPVQTANQPCNGSWMTDKQIQDNNLIERHSNSNETDPLSSVRKIKGGTLNPLNPPDINNISCSIVVNGHKVNIQEVRINSDTNGIVYWGIWQGAKETLSNGETSQFGFSAPISKHDYDWLNANCLTSEHSRTIAENKYKKIESESTSQRAMQSQPVSWNYTSAHYDSSAKVWNFFGNTPFPSAIKANVAITIITKSHQSKSGAIAGIQLVSPTPVITLLVNPPIPSDMTTGGTIESNKGF